MCLIIHTKLQPLTTTKIKIEGNRCWRIVWFIVSRCSHFSVVEVWWGVFYLWCHCTGVWDHHPNTPPRTTTEPPPFHRCRSCIMYCPSAFCFFFQACRCIKQNWTHKAAAHSDPLQHNIYSTIYINFSLHFRLISTFLYSSRFYLCTFIYKI